jgi:hypothetical protein
MASFHVHVTVSSALGAAYGGLLWWQLDWHWGTAALAGGFTGIGGVLPDLDSDSGIPVREMFGLAAVFVPLLLLRRLISLHLTEDQILVVLGALFIAIRYGVARIFKTVTVHRGMFHSVPAMFISGLATLLLYRHPESTSRLLVSAGVMIGFLSHLLLDELYAIDFRGLTPKLNQFAGSALKFRSKSAVATGTTYMMLLALGVAALVDLQREPTLQVAGRARRASATDRGLPPLSLPGKEAGR